MDQSLTSHEDESQSQPHTLENLPQPHLGQRPVPRRKYQRQETGSLQEELGSGDDPGSMSESEEHEMDDMRSEIDEETGLTAEEQQKHFERKRQHDDLDARIAGEGKLAQSDSADKLVIRNLLINAALIGLWYLFSLSISIVSTFGPCCRTQVLTRPQYNKWMFSSDHLDFHFPLFTTSLHMLVQFFLASLLLAVIPSLRPHPTPVLAGPMKPLITPLFYFTRLVPCGATTSLDIGLGNNSLRYITLTFYTMCKSSVLGFVLLFAFLFRLESPNLKLILIIVVMIIGVTMMVAGETTFNAVGFAFIISSSFFSGFRWALTQILLLRHPATSNPFATMFWLAPIMFVTLFSIALVSETPAAVLTGIRILSSTHGAWKSAVLLIFPGTLAFCMTTAEFALLKRTNVVTLSICGIFKEVVTISAAGAVFGDALTPVNISGLIVTLASIAAYNYLKISKMRSEAREKAELESRGAFKPIATEGSLEHEDFDLDLSDDEDNLAPSKPQDGDDRLRRKVNGTSEHDPGERSGLARL